MIVVTLSVSRWVRVAWSPCMGHACEQQKQAEYLIVRARVFFACSL